MGQSLPTLGRTVSGRWLAAGRPHRAVHAQPCALPGSDVRGLVGRPGGRAHQCQTALARGPMDRRQRPSPLGFCDRRHHHPNGRNAHRPGPCDRRRQRPSRCFLAVHRPHHTHAHHRAPPPRCGLVVLHQRHHRQTQRRDDHPPQFDEHGADLFQRCRSGCAHGLHCLCRAHVTRRGHLRHSTPDGRCPAHGAPIGWV